MTASFGLTVFPKSIGAHTAEGVVGRRESRGHCPVWGKKEKYHTSYREERKMKVVAFNGSPPKDGNTAILINYVLGALQKEGIETEVF